LRYDYVFVGAGPANLAAANVLLERGISNFLILEEGSALNKRGCPGLHQSLCTYCNGKLCHVAGGEGGSSARFGNKLCYFPASNRILEYFDQEAVNSSSQYLDGLLSPHFHSRFSRLEPHYPTEPDLDVDSSFSIRKHYTSDVLLRRDFGQLVQRLLACPREAGLVQLNTPVVEIVKLPNSGFRLISSAGSTVESNHVVLGCGRTSHRFLEQVFARLDIDWEHSRPDIGIRLEAPREFFTSEFTYQEDPKYKFSHLPYGTSRTFCGCHGGIIVPVKFGDSYYADGAFGDDFSDSSNVAFMVRSEKPMLTHDLERWCRAVNTSAGDSLLLGEVPLNVTDPERLVTTIMGLVPHWPTEGYQFMVSELLTLTLCSQTTLLKRCERGSASVKVYGPAIDLYWPRPKLARGLKTNVSGLFVLGDVTGVSRGFVQAMVSGATWALTHLAEFSRPNAVHSMRKEVGEWFVLA
jgi:uncharacterized FAD-dependent dehydrogenase